MHFTKVTMPVAFVLVAGLSCSWAAERLFDSAGVRSGFTMRPANDRFVQTELFGELNLPWKWRWGEHWCLSPQLEASAGWLNRQHADAFIGSLGPQLRLRRNTCALELVGGLNLTYLSRSTFGDWDLGSSLQFTSHVGLRWAPGRHWEVGYRLQHLSNGGFARPNPGLNLHMFLIGYRF